ncbi:MAG: hypothetical protein JO126_08270 [Alphaproteobacteria bacterium]|nr:hypothetical protein [Alphaproteobacteria bacterium]
MQRRNDITTLMVLAGVLCLAGGAALGYFCWPAAVVIGGLGGAGVVISTFITAAKQGDQAPNIAVGTGVFASCFAAVLGFAAHLI